MAEFERDLLVVRTQAGLVRAKEQGKVLGRPARLTAGQKRDVVERLASGSTVSAMAREFGVDRRTIQHARDKAKLCKQDDIGTGETEDR